MGLERLSLFTVSRCSDKYHFKMTLLRKWHIRCAAYFIMVAMLINALVPIGYMPSYDEDGNAAIVMCSGHGPATHVSDMAPMAGSMSMPASDMAHDSSETDHSENNSTPHPDAPCQFKPVVSYGLGDITPALLPVFVAHNTAALSLKDFSHYTIAVKPWTAQAPPSFS